MKGISEKEIKQILGLKTSAFNNMAATYEKLGDFESAKIFSNQVSSVLCTNQIELGA
jgi:hypothetical protein